MEHIKKRIGENLYNVRNQSSLTLQQLSDITSVSKTMLSSIEKGDMNPSLQPYGR